MTKSKKAVAMITAAAMVVMNAFGNYTAPITALAAENAALLTDADLDSAYQAASYARDSVHDPSIVVDESGGTRTYYVFGSHMGVSKTTDLMNWTPVTNESTDSTLFSSSYNEAFRNNAYKGKVTVLVDGKETEVDFGTYDASAWNTMLDNYTVQGNMWAPDVIYNPEMKKWCMYLSLNGSTWNSVVILLTADAIEGPYTYQGPVIYSGFNGDNSDRITCDKTDLSLIYPGITNIPDKYKVGNKWGDYYPHAIDPAVSYDEEGKLWMTYGSWSGGIYVIELDEKTGLRDYTVEYEDIDVGTTACSSDQYFGKKIAGGAYVSGEGSYIEKIGDYWYLFMSYGFYSPDGGYEMRIFRSENIDGPYVDSQGNSACYDKYEMNYGVRGTTRGEKLMSGYQWDTMSLGEISEGHNSAFVDNDGNAYVIYHTKFNDGTAGHQLRVHQLFLNEDGWLTVAPYEYSGETVNDSTLAGITWNTKDITGDYQVIIHKYGMDYENLETVLPSDIILHEDGSITGDYTGSWSIANGSYVNITLNDVLYKGELIRQTVDGLGTTTLCFTAASASGVNVWGSKTVDAEAAIAYTRNQLNLQNAAAIFPISGNVFDDVTLPTKGYLGTTVTWSSSNEAVLSSDGTVTVPENDTKVSMTCTVSRDGFYYEKVYDVVVVGENSRNGDTESGRIALFEFEDNYVDSISNIEGSIVTQENATAPSIKKDSTVNSKVVQINFGYNDAGTSNYISIPNPLKGNTTDEATISLLVKRSDADVWDTLWGIVDEDDSDNVTGRLYLTPNAYLGFNGTGGWFDANHASTVTNAIPVSEWSLVTVALDSKGYDIYVDGTLKYTEAYSNTFDSGEGFADYQNVMNLISSANDFYLGYGSWWGSAPFRADDLTFYNRVLSESDVAKLYEDFQKKMNPVTTETLNKTETTVYSDNDLTVGSKTDGAIDTMVWYDYTNFYGVQAGGDFRVNWKFTNQGGDKNWLHYIISVTTDPESTSATESDWNLRADAWSINCFNGLTPSYTYDWNWDDFVALMNGAAVDATLSRKGETMTFSAVISGTDGNTYHYTAVVEGAPTEDVMIYLGGENCYLEVTETTVATAADTEEISVHTIWSQDTAVGSLTEEGTPNTMEWWNYSNFLPLQASGDFSANWKFINQGGTENWLHYNISVTTDSDRTNALESDWNLRADAYSINCFNGLTPAYTSDWNWNNFITLMNGAAVDATLSRKGETMTFSAEILGSDNNTYHYTAVVDGAPTEDVMVYLGGENCYLDVDEYSVTLCSKETQEIPDPPVTPDETDRTLDEVNSLRTYFNDFEQGAGNATVVGSGAFEQTGSTVYGQIFHNAAEGQAIRTNYLLLPEDTIANATGTDSKEMSIGFWINAADAADYFYTPLFSAYGSAPTESGNTWPMFVLQSRLLAQINCAGYTDFTKEDNVAGTNKESTAWLDDKEWHYYTASITLDSVKIYVDGALQNEWELDSSEGHTVAGLFTNGADLKYICLGGNQAWNWSDVDASYQFDDIAVYSTALSGKEIATIMNAKAESSVHVHELVHHEALEATCTEAGNIEYWTCSGCDRVFSDEAGTVEITLEDVVTAAHGHDLIYHEAKKATGRQDGNIEYWECQICHTLFTDENGENVTDMESVIIKKSSHGNNGNGNGNQGGNGNGNQGGNGNGNQGGNGNGNGNQGGNGNGNQGGNGNGNQGGNGNGNQGGNGNGNQGGNGNGNQGGNGNGNKGNGGH